MDDRERDHRTIGCLDAHFFQRDGGEIDRRQRAQACVGHASRAVVITVPQLRMCPRLFREQQAIAEQCRYETADRAVIGQRHRLRQRRIVRHPLNAAEPAVERLDVQRVARRAEVPNDRLRLVDQHRRVGDVGVAQAGAQHLEARRMIVRQQIHVVAVHIHVGHAVGHREQLPPGCC